jgi:hypothetical protein
MKKIIGALSGVALAVVVLGVATEVRAATDWDVTGTYVIDLVHGVTHYPETLVLTQSGTNITGVSLNTIPVAPGSAFTVIGGSVSGNTITLTADHVTSGLVIQLTGNIAANGSMGGDWADVAPGTRIGTWTTTSGAATDIAPPERPADLWMIAPDEGDGRYECGDVSVVQRMWPEWTENTDADFSHYEYSSFNPGSQGLDEEVFATPYFHYMGAWMPSYGTYGFAVRSVDKAGNKSDWALSAETLEGSCQITYIGTLSATPGVAYNPVGTEHTVEAYVGAAVPGVDLIFAVDGANDAGGVVKTTGTDGKITFTYTGNNAGMDTITVCVDENRNDGCDKYEKSVEVTKYWLQYYVTGGAHEKDARGKKNLFSWAGNVGTLLDGTRVGHFTTQDFTSNNMCKYTDFSVLSFSGVPTGSPESDLNKATFTANGSCKDGSTPTITFVITDVAEPGAGFDTIKINDGAPITIDGGNFQVHPPEMPAL